jgi:argininosuccinate lyase
VCATDLADYLVIEGVPFRDAHHIVGDLVRKSEDAGVQLGGLDASVLAAAHASLQKPEARQVLDPAAAVERRKLIGGPAKERVLAEISAAKEHWAALRGR